MGRPDPRRPRAGQDSLFEDIPATPAGKVLRGRHSEAVDRALDAAREAQLIGDVDEALATVVRAGAWALDAGEASNKPYLPSKTIPAITEAIRELGMTPDARKSTTDDAIRELLADLADAEPAHDDTALPHPEG